MEDHQTINRNETPTVKTELSWVAYYFRFKQEHGYPVQHKGRLLFPDGWTYSATDYAGPEWPPPKSTSVLLRLRLAYWETRLQTVREEHRVLKSKLEGFRRLQQGRSVPLQQYTAEYHKGFKRKLSEPADLDLEAFQGRFEWLGTEIRDCYERIKEIKEQMK